MFWTVVFIAVVVGSIYWYTKPAPTCFDGKLNGNEKGVDCGGSCQKVCSTDVLPVVNEWIRAFPEYSSTGQFTDQITVVALNRNPNNATVENLNYRLSVFGDPAEQIAGIENSVNINPLEEFLIFENNIPSRNPNPTQLFVEFDQGKWLKPLRQTPKVSARPVQYEDDNFSRLTAEVTNESLIDLHDTVVTAVLLDSSGNAFSASQTVVEFLPKESRKTVFFTWPIVLEQPPAGYLILPQVDVFNLQ